MVAKERISYYYDEEVGRSYYGPNHPMKPHRLCMTHNLVLAYDLHKHLQIFRPRASTNDEFTQFHSEDYVSFLSKITPDKQHQYVAEMQRFNPNRVQKIQKIERTRSEERRLPRKRRSKNAIHNKYLKYEYIE